MLPSDNEDEDGPSLLSDGTKRALASVERMWPRWLANKKDRKNFPCNLKMLFFGPSEGINDYLPMFFSEVRKENGHRYPPEQLKHVFRLMQVLVKDLGLNFNLLLDEEFLPTRKHLNDLKEQVAADGYQPHKRTIEIVTPEMEQDLYRKGILGDTSPKILLQTVYFIVCKHFAFFSRQNHRELSFGAAGQIKVKGVRPNEFVQYVERLSKNSRRGLKGNKHGLKTSEIRPTGERNCPVRLIKLYMSKVPACARAFYCQPASTFKAASGRWYKNTPIGKNALSSLMREIAEAAGWDKNKIWTGSSLKALALTAPMESNVSDPKFRGVTEHEISMLMEPYLRFQQTRKRASTMLSAPGSSRIFENNAIYPIDG